MAIALASLGWGSGSVATRAALLEGVHPILLITLRFAAATAVLGAAQLLGGAIPRTGQLWRRGAVLGVFNMAGPTIFFTLALEHLSAGVGGILISLAPIATAVLAHFLLRDEPLERAKLAGLTLALAGVAVLLLSGESGIPDGGNTIVGGALSLVGVALAAFGGVLGRRFTDQHRVRELALPQFVSAAVAVVLINLVVADLDVGTLTSAAWWLVAYLAVVSTVVPFILFLVAIRLSNVTQASLVGYFVPLVGVLGGIAFLDEHVTISILAGGVLILAGVLIVDRAQARLRTSLTSHG